MCAWQIDPRIETVVISPEQVEQAFLLLASIVDAYDVWKLTRRITAPPIEEIRELLHDVRDANYPKALDV